MTVSPSKTGKIEWNSFVFDEKWGQFVLDAGSLEILASSAENVGQTLRRIFLWLKAQGYENSWKDGVSVRTDADFDMQWGLGSSSTLVSLLSQWTGADPYALQFAVFGGSGYDIACATAEGPLIYRLADGEGKPEVREADFHPPFSDRLHFIYTGRKKDSRAAIAEFKAAGPEELLAEIAALDRITEEITACTDLPVFEKLVAEHEKIIASALKTTRIKDLHFPGYPHGIKSLGGWGGDFILATGEAPVVREYFTGHGLSPIFSFDELTKHRNVHA